MDLNTLLIAVLGLLVIGLGIIVMTLHTRLSKLLRGKNAESLERAIYAIAEEIEKVHTSHTSIKQTLELFDRRIRRCIKNVKTIRFNPFQDSGGNQSFSVSLINEDGDGVVISSLYSREKTSVFAKPIASGTSSYELTKEETEVIKESHE